VDQVSKDRKGSNCKI